MFETDVIEENSMHLFSTKQEIFDDDGFLSSLDIDTDIPMTLQNDIDFSAFQPDFNNSSLSSTSSRTTFTDNDFISSSPVLSAFDDIKTEAHDTSTFNGFVNPDDFISDIFKTEIKSEINSPPRNTPSPSGSSGSSEFGYFSIINKQTDSASFTTNLNTANVLDTPPISPPALNTATSPTNLLSPTSIISPLSPLQPIILNSATTTGFKVVQGTLIPINKIPLQSAEIAGLNTPKKIKIQPKPTLVLSNGGGCKTNGGNISKPNSNKKTVILSAQDFTALVNNMKNKKNGSSIDAKKSIILQANTPIIKKEPHVLPKTTLGQPTTIFNRLTSNSIAPTPISNVSCFSTNSSTTTVTFTSPKTKLIMNNEIDERAFKKQQRMIKNRESACLSRKKKKEYVTALENQITDLRKENSHLKSENFSLREQLRNLDIAICHCKKLGNILNTNVGTPSVKKTTAFLLAMVFMVTINLGPMSGYFLNGADVPSDASTSFESALSSSVVHRSRGLLWVDESITNNTILGDYDTESSNNEKPTTVYPICPMHVNQTESVRLASELRRWIGEPEYFNLSSVRDAAHTKLDQNNFDVKALPELFGSDKIKNYLLRNRKIVKRPTKKSRQAAAAANHEITKDLSQNLQPYQATKHIQVFDPVNYAEKYAEFFEEIRRRDDTFYVVSFSGDHLLLPALAHNKTLRPKMSLMLPALSINNDSFSNDYVTLMQIDCEVINTSMLRVREKYIPDNLKQPAKSNNEKSSNVTNKQATATATTASTTVVRNNETLDGKFNHRQRNVVNRDDGTLIRNYKPYFIDKAGSNEAGGGGRPRPKVVDSSSNNFHP